MVDEVSSFVAAADVLKMRGAYKIFVIATHGLLSADAPQMLENSAIDEVSPAQRTLTFVKLYFIFIMY